MSQELKRPEIIRVDEKQLQDKGHGTYTGLEYHYKGKPFSGFVVYDYHENGNILFETEHANGQTMGWKVEYYENGKIKRERINNGATTVVFRTFDTEGNLENEHWFDKPSYNEVTKETGMDPIEL